MAGFQLDETAVSQLVKLMDADTDHEINVDELIKTVMSLRHIIINIIITTAQSCGRIDAGIWLKTFWIIALMMTQCSHLDGIQVGIRGEVSTTMSYWLLPR